MTAPQQQKELIAELTARTGVVAEAASRAVDGLPSGQDELVSAVIAQLRSVNDECQRIHGVLERVSAMIAEPEPAPAPAPEPPAPPAAPPPVAEPPAPGPAVGAVCRSRKPFQSAPGQRQKAAPDAD